MGYLSPPPSPAPVIVYKDVGGLVTDYEARTEQYRQENREVRLHECRSACTLALSLPNVCVYPDAKVKFHQAYNEITRETDYGVSAKLFASYPAAVQARLGYLTREYRILTGTDLIALGMRNCNGDSPTMIASRKQRQQAATAVASARPEATPAAGGLNPFGDLARRVQTAVASALSVPEEGPRGAIRVAVADRSSISPPDASSANAVARSAPAVAVSGASVTTLEVPLPPRRPPSEAFTSRDAAPKNLLIPGAHPILSAQFMRSENR